MKKQKEKEEKEKRKLEREKKKEEREKEMQRKAEARAQKAAEKAKKQAEKEKNAREKTAERLKKTQEKAARAPATQRARSTASSTEERALDKEPRSKAPNRTDDTIDFDRCCACFGLYVDDAGTDREWIECSCSRWIHEECVENVIHDANGKELLCPVCLSSV